MQAPESFPTGAAAAALTARRLKCCDELVRRVSEWLLPVTPRTDASWPRQRQIELVLRARQSMLGVVLLSRHELWMPAYATARMLLEDAAVAHWLAVHPDLRVLEACWSEHLSAMRYGDIKAQRELGLEVDHVNVAWLAEQDEETARRVAERHRSAPPIGPASLSRTSSTAPRLGVRPVGMTGPDAPACWRRRCDECSL